VNDGVATFAISGTPAAGNTLTASITTPDPDGDGLTGYTYIWETSSNGNTWSQVGNNSPAYTPVAADAGQTIRLRITYTDAQLYSEEVIVQAGIVAQPVLTQPTLITALDLNG
jgi:hypothetical protein